MEMIECARSGRDRPEFSGQERKRNANLSPKVKVENEEEEIVGPRGDFPNEI